MSADMNNQVDSISQARSEIELLQQKVAKRQRELNEAVKNSKNALLNSSFRPTPTATSTPNPDTATKLKNGKILKCLVKPVPLLNNSDISSESDTVGMSKKYTHILKKPSVNKDLLRQYDEHTSKYNNMANKLQRMINDTKNNASNNESANGSTTSSDCDTEIEEIQNVTVHAMPKTVHSAPPRSTPVQQTPFDEYNSDNTANCSFCASFLAHNAVRNESSNVPNISNGTKAVEPPFSGNIQEMLTCSLVQCHQIVWQQQKELEASRNTIRMLHEQVGNLTQNANSSTGKGQMPWPASAEPAPAPIEIPTQVPPLFLPSQANNASQVAQQRYYYHKVPEQTATYMPPQPQNANEQRATSTESSVPEHETLKVQNHVLAVGQLRNVLVPLNTLQSAGLPQHHHIVSTQAPAASLPPQKHHQQPEHHQQQEHHQQEYQQQQHHHQQPSTSGGVPPYQNVDVSYQHALPRQYNNTEQTQYTNAQPEIVRPPAKKQSTATDASQYRNVDLQHRTLNSDMQQYKNQQNSFSNTGMPAVVANHAYQSARLPQFEPAPPQQKPLAPPQQQQQQHLETLPPQQQQQQHQHLETLPPQQQLAPPPILPSSQYEEHQEQQNMMNSRIVPIIQHSSPLVPLQIPLHIPMAPFVTNYQHSANVNLPYIYLPQNTGQQQQQQQYFYSPQYYQQQQQPLHQKPLLHQPLQHQQLLQHEQQLQEQQQPLVSRYQTNVQQCEQGNDEQHNPMINNNNNNNNHHHNQVQPPVHNYANNQREPVRR